MKINAILFTLAILLGSYSTASASICGDLWWQRNSIFNANGYCFSSRLGRAYFDNYNCHTKNPRFSSHEQVQVDYIKNEERRIGCRVDTSKTRLR